MERDLPIAEIFDSVQGEGQWVGTRMLFIRLAGCNVGKPRQALKISSPFPILPTGKEAVACTSWDGRSFPCDTDYTIHQRVTTEYLVEEIKNVGVSHVCITGGEPLLHYPVIENLFTPLAKLQVQIHIETSGTIVPKPLGGFRKLLLPGYWVTVSPKINAQDEMIRRADELKLLVDEQFDVERLTLSMLSHKNVFVCPINDVNDVKHDNVQRCVDLQKRFPNWRVSVQMHKIFNWR
jgi:7-carboxy-7-deazaguanine synthase